MPGYEFPSLQDFSRERLIQVADEHDDLAFAAMLGTHQRMRRHGDLFELITGLHHPLANMLFGMSVGRAEERVRAVTNELSAEGLPAYWWVGPCTTPKELPQTLIANGWERGPSGAGDGY